MTTTGIETRPVRTRLPAWLMLPGFAGLGVLAGVAAKAADESGIGWTADLGTYPAAWVLAVALIGRYAPTMQLAPWLVLSTTAVAGAAVAAWWATRRAGPLPGVLMALAAGIALAGGSVQRLYWTWTGEMPDLAARPIQATIDVLTALTLTLVLPRQWSTRLWATALVLPSAWLAAAGLQQLYQVVG
jgi:hypothetical protein